MANFLDSIKEGLDIGQDSITSLVPRTLFHILALPDAAISFKWLVQFPKLPQPYEGLGRSSNESVSDSWSKINAKGNSFLDKASNLVSSFGSAVSNTLEKTDNYLAPTNLMLRAESVTIPHEKVNTKNFLTQARQRPLASSISVSNLDIDFYEDYNYTVFNYMNQWQKCIVNEYGIFRPPGGENGYAKEIRIHIFDSVGLKKATIYADDAFPTDIKDYSYDSDSNAIKTSCTFSISRIRWDLSNLGSTIATGKALTQNLINRFK